MKLRSFFQQDDIKEAIGSWQNPADHRQGDLTAYLSGDQQIPDIRDLSWFEKRLSGDTMFSDVDVRSLVDLLGDKIWEPEALQKILGDQLQQYSGQRLRFVNNVQSSESSEKLIAWCAEQCLKFGLRLPEGMNSGDLSRISSCLRSEWVSDAALSRLEQLGLDSMGVNKLLGWTLKGQVSLPKEKPKADTPLFAVQEFLYPDQACNPERLAVQSESLYRYHSRFAAMAGKLWLNRLDQLATHSIDPPPLPLTSHLEENLQAQWLLLDCWGLPLFRPVMKIIESVFDAWKPERNQFAVVGGQTTTDSCYRQLLDGEISHPFEKCNVIDQALHHRNLEFSEFTKIVATELEIALARLSGKLDPTQDLLIFADHGFRLDSAGRRFQHGGDSTLERVVPICLMSSRDKG